MDWQPHDRAGEMLEFTRRLIALRKSHPVLQRLHFFKGDQIWDSQFKDLAWFQPDGAEMTPEDWKKPFVRAMAFFLGGDAFPYLDERGRRVVDDSLFVMMNAHDESLEYRLPPELRAGSWRLEIDTADWRRRGEVLTGDGRWTLIGRSMAVFSLPSPKVLGEAEHVEDTGEVEPPEPPELGEGEPTSIA